MKIIRKRLYESEGLSATVRWNEDCDCVQSLFGDTWVDNPTADPRYNPGNLAPPNATADPRCSAAFGMRTKVENIMNAFFLADALIDAANSILALITITLPGVGLIWRVIFAVCEALYAIGTAALVAAFTEEAYEELQCIFYVNIDEDGRMSATQLSDINTQICEDMDLTICAAMGLILNMLGEVGMSNAGAMFGEDSDCDYCPVFWCNHFPFEDSTAWEWNSFAFPVTNGMDSAGWVSANASGGTYLNIEWSFPATKIASIAFSFGVSDSYPSSGSGTWITAFVDGVETDLTGYLYPPPGISGVGWTGVGTLDNVTKIRLKSQINAVIITHCYYATINGEDVNPEGGIPC